MERLQDNGTTSCNGCPLVDRREFLRDAGAIAAGVLIALGVSPANAMAAPIRFVTGTRHGDEHSYPLPAADGTQIDRDNDAIVTRYQGKVYVFSLACPHQNTALRWEQKDNEFQCPKHHSKYRPDGTFIEGRATRSMDRFAVRKDGGNVIADFNKLYQEDQDDAWKTAFVSI